MPPIPCAIDPMGARTGIEIIDDYVEMTHAFYGVAIPGLTSAATTRIKTEIDVWRSSESSRTYGRAFQLYNGSTITGERYFVINYYSATVAGFSIENNAGTAGANINASGAHTITTSPDGIFFDGVRKVSTPIVAKDGSKSIRPLFYNGGGYELFKIRDLKIWLDDGLIQWYKPARYKGKLGMYELVSKTFCPES